MKKNYSNNCFNYKPLNTFSNICQPNRLYTSYLNCPKRIYKLNNNNNCKNIFNKIISNLNNNGNIYLDECNNYHIRTISSYDCKKIRKNNNTSLDNLLHNLNREITESKILYYNTENNNNENKNSENEFYNSEYLSNNPIETENNINNSSINNNKSYKDISYKSRNKYSNYKIKLTKNNKHYNSEFFSSSNLKFLSIENCIELNYIINKKSLFEVNCIENFNLICNGNSTYKIELLNNQKNFIELRKKYINIQDESKKIKKENKKLILSKNELEKNIENIKKENENKINEIENKYKIEIDKLKENNNNINNNINNNEIIENYKKEIEKLNNKIILNNNLKKEFNKLSLNNDDLLKNEKILKNKIIELENKLNNNNNNKILIDYENKINEIKKTSNESLKKLEKENKNLLKNFESKEKEIKKLNKKLNKKLTFKNTLSIISFNFNLLSNINNIEINNLKTQLNEKELSIKTYISQINNLQEKIKDFENKSLINLDNNNLNNNNKLDENDIESLQLTITNLKEIIKSKEEENINLLNKINNFNIEFKKYEQEINEDKIQLKAEIDQNSFLKNEIKLYEDKLNMINHLFNLIFENYVPNSKEKIENFKKLKNFINSN